VIVKIKIEYKKLTLSPIILLPYFAYVISNKERQMDGGILISYKVLCEGDFYSSITIEELLKNENILKLIKSEFAKGHRNIDINFDKNNTTIQLVTKKDIQTFEANKNDYADILVLAEEDATAKKLFKKDCSVVELVDIETFSNK